MRATDAAQAAEWAGGRLAAGAGETRIESVSTDTRQLRPGSLFVALAGERFDGHAFLEEAGRRGAAAVLVHREDAAGWGGFRGAVIRVEDTLEGLQRLASAYRGTLGLRAVGVTGSNGKTSTKDMLRRVLEGRGRVCATRGNLNNHIGLPLTLLEAEPEDAFGVWEMGMNHAGEIAPLAALARPEAGVITNIGTAHIGFLGSREAIAREKGMLAEALPEGGVLVLNANDDCTPGLRGRTVARVIEAGIGAGDVQARELSEGEAGTRFQLCGFGQRCDAFLPVPGRHMVSNAVLAVAVGISLGIGLEEAASALEEVELSPGRVQLVRSRGVVFLQDAYNANPESMKASLVTLAALRVPGRRFAVLGEMGELGERSEAAHREVGEAALASGVDVVASVGAGARGLTAFLGAGEGGCRVEHFEDHRAVAEYLRAETGEGDAVLLKGSRTARLEEVFRLYGGEEGT